jgi:hypothetical protein
MPYKIFTWEGSEYKVDLDAPAGERVLVKEGDKFVSKPDLGKLAATLEFEGILVGLDNK